MFIITFSTPKLHIIPLRVPSPTTISNADFLQLASCINAPEENNNQATQRVKEKFNSLSKLYYSIAPYYQPVNPNHIIDQADFADLMNICSSNPSANPNSNTDYNSSIVSPATSISSQYQPLTSASSLTSDCTHLFTFQKPSQIIQKTQSEHEPQAELQQYLEQLNIDDYVVNQLINALTSAHDLRNFDHLLFSLKHNFPQVKDMLPILEKAIDEHFSLKNIADFLKNLAHLKLKIRINQTTQKYLYLNNRQGYF